MLVVVSHGDQNIVGDLGIALRTPGADDVSDTDRIGRADGKPLQHLPDEISTLRIDMRDRDRLYLARLAGEINAAPVRQARHGKLRELLEGALVVERGDQQGR